MLGASTSRVGICTDRVGAEARTTESANCIGITVIEVHAIAVAVRVRAASALETDAVRVAVLNVGPVSLIVCHNEGRGNVELVLGTVKTHKLNTMEIILHANEIMRIERTSMRHARPRCCSDQVRVCAVHLEPVTR